MKKYIKLSALSLVDTDTLTGYFIDAPVQSLAYKTTSGLTGTTGSAFFPTIRIEKKMI